MFAYKLVACSLRWVRSALGGSGPGSVVGWGGRLLVVPEDDDEEEEEEKEEEVVVVVDEKSGGREG